MTRKEYEKALRKLQVELCGLQDWVKHKGLRVVVIFEGRDAAGKGGTIKAIIERVSPRVFRVVALPAPSDREKSQLWHCQLIAGQHGHRAKRGATASDLDAYAAVGRLVMSCQVSNRWLISWR